MSAKEFLIEVSPRIPERIARLEELATNLWYSWERPARELFGPLDPVLWNAVGHNPKLFLRRVAEQRLEAAARDPYFLGRYHQVLTAFDSYRGDVEPKMSAQALAGDDLVAYFCAEYGLHESMPIYSGGLGVLAGDHCKTASDLRMPFVAVGLLYRAGYFSQEIDDDGRQVARYLELDLDHLPVTSVLQADGTDLRVSVPIGTRTVHARVWRAVAGHVHIYLLDTDVAANRDEDRAITYQLYGGGTETRIQQEMVLGIGGVRALRALGMAPTVWHANEGHAAFMVLERARELVDTGLGFDAAMEVVAASTVFTTHTPVPAGHDHFHHDTMAHYFQAYLPQLGIALGDLMELGRLGAGAGEAFNMTALALHGSRHHNGVSRIHGEVSSQICAPHWPEVAPDENPMDYITNGVHLPTFLQTRWDDLLDRMLGAVWRGRLTEDAFWRNVENIPDHLFWSVRQSIKSQALHAIREALVLQHTRNQVSEPHIERMLRHIDSDDPNVLTIGFARRFATYKRAALLLRDVEWIEEIVGDAQRPVVFIFAGKAHPADEPGQGIMRYLHEMSARPSLVGKLLILEGYDIGLARRLVSGVDVWLNTPVYPMEASGTSGMKAAINGTLNLSVTDGWWAEGFNGSNGWAIRPSPHTEDHERRDSEDARTLYEILQDDVLPLYYNRSQAGYSPGWVAMSKRSMATILPRFNMCRVLNEYVDKLYRPAGVRGRVLAAGGGSAGRELANWKQRVRRAWPSVEIRLHEPPRSKLRYGEGTRVEAEVNLAGLEPHSVVVEMLLSPVASQGAPVGGGFTALESAPGLLRNGSVLRQVLCFEPAQDLGEGRYLYRLEVTPEFCGQLSFRVRVYPYHHLLVHRFDMGMTRWA